MIALHHNAPRFNAKLLNIECDDLWDGEWYYHFQCDFDWKEIEWLDLRATGSEITLDGIEEICRFIGFEVERHDDRLRIMGYRKMLGSRG